MRKRIAEKLIATILTLTLTMANALSLAQGVFAATKENNTNNKNVKFDSYWKQEEKNVQMMTGKPKDKQLLYIKVGVNQYGYLKEGTISLKGNNFKLENEVSESNVIKEINTESNTIKINQINNGGEVEIAIPVSFDKQKAVNLSYFEQETAVELNAIYMDEKGKEVEVSGKVKVQLNWKTEAELELKQEVEKYLKIGESTILQTKLEWGVKESSLPIEEANVEVTVPEIKGVKPSKVKVLAVNSLEEISSDNYKYNKETGKISISIQNPVSKENTVKWNEEKEVYKIIYEYEKIGLEKTKIELASKVTGKLYHKQEQVDATENKTQEIEQQGSIVSGKLEVLGDISKGYLYANSNYETNYEVRETVEISDVEYAKEIEITHGMNFILEEGSLAGENSSYYEETKMKKAEIDAILGEAGSLDIIDNKGNVVAEINKQTKADEQGNIVISYEKQVTNIAIKIHNPEKEGQLEIQSKKKIKGQTGYSIQEMKQMKKIEEKQEIKLGDALAQAKGELALKETTIKAEITMNTTNLSTVMKNENMEMRVVLNSDNSSYDLWKNPIIEIELPKEVEVVTIKSINLLFSNELKIKNYEVIEKENGNKAIKIVVEGNQTKFTNDLSKGIHIVLGMDITVNKEAVTGVKQLKMYYQNEKAVIEGTQEVTYDFNMEAPVGVIALNSISNFKGNEKITSISTKESMGELEIFTESKIATMTMDVINNYEQDIKNPKILGRIPYTGNTKTTGEKLGTTFDAKLVSKMKEVKVEGNYAIYYSEKEYSTEDLNKAENGWTTEPQDLGKVKSYLIVFENYTMPKGKALTFSYDMEIPANLNHNQSAFGTYTVFFENTEIAKQEQVIAPTVGVTTGEGPELETKVTANVENGAEVEEGQIIKYKVDVKNIGKVDVKNVKVVSNIPNNTVYVKYLNEGSYGYNGYLEDSEKTKIEEVKNNLAVGETFTVEFEVRVKELAIPEIVKNDQTTQEEHEKVYGEETGNSHEFNSQIVMNATISADELEKNIVTENYTNTAVKGTFTIELNSKFTPEVLLAVGDEITYTGRIVNMSSTAKKNVIIIDKLPEGLVMTKAVLHRGDTTITEGITYDEKTNTITFTVGDMQGSEKILLEIKAKVSNLKENETERELKNAISVQSEEMSSAKISNEVINTVAIPKLSAKQTSNKESSITSKEEIEYYVTIKNEGKMTANNVIIKDILPEELTLKKIRYQIGDKGESENSINTKENSCKLQIPAGTTAVVTFVAEAKPLEADKQITNKIEITSENAGNIAVNSLTHTITKSEEVETPSGEKVKVYTVSGTAWEDANKNGKKEEDEPKLAGIEVMLVDSQTGKLAKTVETQEDQITTTNSEGAYIFKQVREGQYLVVFLYDNKEYSVASYKQEGVAESENSDVISMEITLNGEKKIAAVSDTFTVKEAGVSGINMGIMKMSIFQLKLEKSVNRIVVQNTKGTKQYEFENAKLAKTDVDGKYINSTTVLIEYKIRVTNTGDVPGYAKKIVDYIPGEMKFSSEMNENWYSGKEGEIYTTSLADTPIQPGETKEMTITLTKKMNETANGTFQNSADLLDSYNEYGIGNTAVNSKEEKSADVIIGIKTGKEVSYIICVISAMIAIVVGAYFINKKVLSKRI